MTPKGYQLSAIRALQRHAKAGDVDGFQAYIRGPLFLEALTKCGADNLPGLLHAHALAALLCEQRTRLPKAPPTRRWGGGSGSIWTQPTELAKLARAYAIAGNDHEKAGRLLGVTAGAARLARKRHLLVSTTEDRRSAA